MLARLEAVRPHQLAKFHNETGQEMNFPNRRNFRLLAITSAVLMVGGAFLEELGSPIRPQEINDALDWNYYGSILPYPYLLAIFWGTSIPLALGLIAFLFFKRWSRKLILFSSATSVITVPFSGLTVSEPISSFFMTIGGVLFIYLFVLSYFSPCDVYFRERTRSAEGEK
jgi:hypothetical protein